MPTLHLRVQRDRPTGRYGAVHPACIRTTYVFVVARPPVGWLASGPWSADGRWWGADDEIADLLRLLGSGDGPSGVAVFGDAGVGKTRLVAEVVDARHDDGVVVEWVRATEVAWHIPLGSFAHLLAPGGDVHHRDDLLHLALARLHDRAGAAGFLLAVDDAHLLDEVSVALLHLAVTWSPVQVLVSVRTGETLPPGLVGLWKDELLARATSAADPRGRPSGWSSPSSAPMCRPRWSTASGS